MFAMLTGESLRVFLAPGDRRGKPGFRMTYVLKLRGRPLEPILD